MFHVTGDMAGGLHVDALSVDQGVKGVGETTGVQYVDVNFDSPISPLACRTSRKEE